MYKRQTVHYTISVPMKDLWYWDADNDIQCYDAGEYTVQVGPDSENTPLTVQFTLGGTLTPKLNTVKVIPSGHILKVGGSLTAELSASRNNQSFVDLDTEGVEVYYTSSNSNAVSYTHLLYQRNLQKVCHYCQRETVTIKNILGHVSVQTTQIYAEMSQGSVNKN